MAFGIPMYVMANTGAALPIVLVFLIAIGVIHAALTGTQAAWFAEPFRTGTRTSGASLGYQTAASVAGFAPFVAVLLTDSLCGSGPRCRPEIPRPPGRDTPSRPGRRTRAPRRGT
ncbi:hypothetical protein [Streptomyces wuyuanensis]|uniref:hypothetical protein n=1 Tax=Streptomyces wuyuanensis TaxID=1196353 RepID=UPI003722768C